ncbi:hypothetical protein [Halostella salina]|uniref:hypothetical protein n=1 Tax=Halostella salina TaxID=1547897 RepID=UPI0013CE4B97|nr:hypothetical protein [Halostella salina]
MVVDPSADATAFVAVLGVHVLAGVAALGGGAGAIVTRKGGRRHNAAGKLYVLSMAVVVATAVPLSVWTTDPFLLAIAVFSGYLVFGGYRVVARRRAGQTAPTAVDYAGHGTMALVGTGMVAWGGWRTVAGPAGLAPALVVFGGIGVGFAALSLRTLRAPPAARPPWVTMHIGYMGGGFIATVTAAVTVNLTFLPPLLRWLGPTAVGVPLIVYAVGAYEQRFGTAKRT